jgi:hypothetical protein
MMYVAVQEKLDSKTVDWMEKISERQYPAVVKSARIA